MCGEKAKARSRCHTFPGSPPRVRGEAYQTFLDKFKGRITPACAGRSGACSVFSTSTWDHPRVCGEKKTLETNVVKGKGSPPRVRGEVKSAYLVLKSLRITPACAGRRI